MECIAMTTRSALFAGPMPGHRRAPRGMVLLISLAVMAAMSLASVALVRAIDTTTAVAGNLAFREAAIAPANAAIEDAFAALFENNAIADREHDLPAQGYYASLRSGEDARGVPLVLQNLNPSARQTRFLDMGMGNTVSYAIERLCVAPGAATPANCNLAVPYALPAVPKESATSPAPGFAIFRITARVDGPQNTLVLVQMMLRDSVPPQRMSWRTLSE
jgi:type IV pilus assembly protein PilX